VSGYIRSKIRCECKNKINVIATDIAFELAERPSPIYYCVDYSSHSIEKVKEWISGTVFQKGSSRITCND
jgi:hypothetical protein